MRYKGGKTGLLLLLLLLITLTMLSCGSSIVGTWTNSVLGYETMLRFNRDGTFNISVLGLLGATGTYSVSGNQIAITLDQDLGVGFPTGASTFSVSGNQLIIDGIVYTRK